MSSLNHYGEDRLWISAANVDRLGIVSMTARLKVNYSNETLLQVLQEALTLRAAPPIAFQGVSLPCIGANAGKIEKGNAFFDYGYEGYNGDLSTSEVIYELEGSDNHEPIETHVYFPSLYKTYGGIPDPNTGQFSYFPSQCPKGVQGIPGPGGTMKNPMAGVTDYLAIGWVWRKTWLSLNLPVNLYDKVGFIDTPPGQGVKTPPQLSAPRNWVKIAPRHRFRGNCWEIVESWLASGRNGWIPAMYQKQA